MAVLVGKQAPDFTATAVFGNEIGLFNDGDTGTLETFGDNLVAGNSADTDGAITTVGTT